MLLFLLAQLVSHIDRDCVAPQRLRLATSTCVAGEVRDTKGQEVKEISREGFLTFKKTAIRPRETFGYWIWLIQHLPRHFKSHRRILLYVVLCERTQGHLCVVADSHLCM